MVNILSITQNNSSSMVYFYFKSKINDIKIVYK
jgi:hypothetical protein